MDDAARQQSITARIERLPYHAWHVKVRLIVGIATFFDAFDALTIAFILPVIIPLWKIAPTEIGLLISSGYIGQLLGALFFGAMAERKGRIPSLAWTVAIFAVFSALCIISWSYMSLLIFRFIQGFGLGGEVPIAAAYINELCKAKGRGRFVLLYEMVFVVGLLFAAILGYWIVPHLGWRYMFVIGALPVFLVPVLLRTVPESPRWLAQRKRFDEAEKVVTDIERIVSEDGRKELPPIDPVQLAPVQAKPTHWVELFQGIYLRRTLSVWVIWFCAYFLTYGLVAWLPSIYSRVFHLPLELSLRYSLITMIVGMFGSLLCALTIDIVGRKAWFVMAFGCGCVLLLILWSTGANVAQTVVLYASLAYFFINSNSLALYLYSPEIYPTRMRALGSGIGSAWLRIASVIGPFVVGVIIAGHSIALVFLVFAIVALVGAIITALFAVETKNKVLEELSP